MLFVSFLKGDKIIHRPIDKFFNFSVCSRYLSKNACLIFLFCYESTRIFAVLH